MAEPFLTPVVLGAVVKAIIGKAIDLLHPEDHLRKWLPRQPAQLAFQKALARAYTAFARNYPDLTASLFNQDFLTHEAAPELAKLLTRHGHPDPATLANMWAASLTARARQAEQREVRAAKQFLAWLESELKAEPALQPLYDSRALDSLPAIEVKLDELTAQVDRALKTAEQYSGVVAQAVAIAERAQVADPVVPVQNAYFSGGFARLADYYVPPDSVFQRVRIRDFVGRDWLTAKVDAFLNDPGRKSGAFLLVGDAGVGKTSFLAHLVHTRPYLHLFGEQFRSQASVPPALRSLAAELVSRYRIEPYAQRDTIPQLVSDHPNFLDQLLRMVSRELIVGEQVVIVCDALDEAGVGPNGNVFGLPSVLPDGVYLILSQRPVRTELHVTPAPHPERLEVRGDENLRDIKEYLTMAARRPEITGQLQAQGYTETDFARALEQKSQGVCVFALHPRGDLRWRPCPA